MLSAALESQVERVRRTEKFRVKITVKNEMSLGTLLWTVSDRLGGEQESARRVPAEICGGKVAAA